MSLSFAPEDRERWIKTLTAIIREGILTTEPHFGVQVGEGRLFSGSYDWHSCVHAHWALLSIARTERDTKLEDFLERRLLSADIEEVRQFLVNPVHAEFELPYGQAWLLLLLSEMEQRAWGKSEAVTGLKAETEERIVAWLEKTPFPDTRNLPLPRNEDPWQDFRGDHYSWLFALLLLQLSKPDRKEIREKIQSLKEKRVEPLRDKLMKNLETDTDFLHIPSILALMDRTDDHPHSREPRPPFSITFQSPLTFKNAHTPGNQATRLWPVAWDCKKGKEGSCRQYWKGMSEFLAHPEQWKDDFRTVSHWVPQFIWMGLWIEMGAL